MTPLKKVGESEALLAATEKIPCGPKNIIKKTTPQTSNKVVITVCYAFLNHGVAFLQELRRGIC